MNNILDWRTDNAGIHTAVVGDNKMVCTAWLTTENRAGWLVGLTPEKTDNIAVSVHLARGGAETVDEAMLQAEAYARAWSLDLACAFLPLTEVTE